MLYLEGGLGMAGSGHLMDNFTAFILGALITVLVSIFFYIQSGRELKREAEALRLDAKKLRELQELTIYALTNPGAKMEPRRDEAGKIVGLIVSATGHAGARVSARGVLTLTPNPDDPTAG